MKASSLRKVTHGADPPSASCRSVSTDWLQLASGQLTIDETDFGRQQGSDVLTFLQTNQAAQGPQLAAAPPLLP
jgi:hypothetical protein